jgi:Ca2+-binding RTX toxin-like protein
VTGESAGGATEYDFATVKYASAGSGSQTDTTPPETTITSGPSGQVSSTSATFEFTASEPSTFACSLDGASFASCASPRTYSGITAGSHTFRVRATDQAGNVDATPAERAWTVVTTSTACTITGTDGPDYLTGTAGADVICARGGNDEAHGGGGNDTILGGSGDDRLFGESGNDTLRGGGGNDRVYGGEGTDSLYGEGGYDLLDGGSGTDSCDVGADGGQRTNC